MTWEEKGSITRMMMRSNQMRQIRRLRAHPRRPIISILCIGMIDAYNVLGHCDGKVGLEKRVFNVLTSSRYTVYRQVACFIANTSLCACVNQELDCH